MSNFVGLDVSKEKTSVCVRDSGGGIVLTAKVATDPEAIVACLADLDPRPERVILETGRMSNWLHNSLVELGLAAVCVDARLAHAILSQMHNKTDANDAAMLAELARTGFYRQVVVKSRAAQLRRTLLQARDLMIRQRLDVDNSIRGLLANLGLKLPKLRRRFPERVAATIDDRPELRLIMQPLLQVRVPRVPRGTPSLATRPAAQSTAPRCGNRKLSSIARAVRFQSGPATPRSPRYPP